MSSIEQAAKAMKTPDSEERLHQILADLNSEAAELEAEARDYEDRMLLCRARAAGLRTGAGGVSSAIERFQEEMARRQEFMASRDGKDDPVNYGGSPERRVRLSDDPHWARRD